MAKSEVIERLDPKKAFPIVTYNISFPEACAKHLKETLHCSKPFIIVSGSLSRNTDAVQRLTAALGEQNVAGVRAGMQPHTLYSEVLEISQEIKKSGADAVITVGGGSLIDGAKGMVFMLANDISTFDAMDTFFKDSNAHRNLSEGTPSPHGHKPSTIPVISVTTTLSAGEYNYAGGATNDVTKHKQLFIDPIKCGPKVIILNPELTLTTPERVWLSTGLRAVDHCVETICSSNPNPAGTARSLRGIKLLIPALLRTKKDSQDRDARLGAQLGSAQSMKAHLLEGVRVGGSHGIGHQLGPVGVPHAETTCVCLPAVQKYNAKVNAEQQRQVLVALWGEPVIAEVLKSRSLTDGNVDLGDALDAIIRELGFPRSLKAYGIGRDKLDQIARNSVEDVCCKWNAIPLEKPEQVLEILEMCLEDATEKEY